MCLYRVENTCKNRKRFCETSGISQEHIGPINIISPPEDKNCNKWIPYHVIASNLMCLSQWPKTILMFYGFFGLKKHLFDLDLWFTSIGRCSANWSPLT